PRVGRVRRRVRRARGDRARDARRGRRVAGDDDRRAVRVPRRADRPPRRSVRIAFVSQPWARALPPSESVAIWSREVGRRLAAAGDEVTIWSRFAHAERDDGVEYRTVDAPWDWRLLRLRPSFHSPRYHGLYYRGI